MQNLCAKLIPGKWQYGRINKVLIYVGFLWKLNFTLKTLAEFRRKSYRYVVPASSYPKRVTNGVYHSETRAKPWPY